MYLQYNRLRYNLKLPRDFHDLLREVDKPLLLHVRL